MIVLTKGVWRANVNFLSVPVELVEQFKGKVSKSEWVVWAKWYNNNPGTWNLAYIEDDTVMVFIYGSWEPLDRELRVVRIVADKRLQGIKGEVLKEAIDTLRVFSKKVNATFVYFETDAWKVFERKLKGEIRVMKARILEVL